MYGDVNDKKGSGFKVRGSLLRLSGYAGQAGFKVRGSEVKRLDSFIFFRFIDFDGRG
jgi:hypothetical protein